MEAHLLRTLSDCGEPLTAQSGEPHVPEPSGQESWQVMVRHAAAGVDQLRVSSPESDASKDESSGEGGAMGDEDEGFDEEFCDSEDPPMRPLPDLPPLNLQDLNNTDIQTLLADNSLVEPAAIVPPFPTTSLLDDIDPGVSMLEAELSTHSLLDSDPGKTSPLHSPFQISAPSPMCASMNLMSVGDAGVLGLSPVDDWNVYSMYGGQYPATSTAAEFGSGVDACTPASYLLPPTSPSLASSSPPPHSSADCYELDMFTSLCNQSPVSDPHYTLVAHSPSPVPSYHPASYPTCTLASSPSPSLPPATPPSDSSQHPFITTSPSYHHHSNYEYNPLLNGQSKPAKGCTGGAGSSSSPHAMATNTNTSTYTSCSTQTPIRTPSPAPSPALVNSGGDDYDDVPKSKPTTAASDKIVHMPFYQFKKIILDSPSLPEEKKNNIKTIRRRGKNKVAAKTCRQRKMDLVLGLQQEIDYLRARKSEITGRNAALLREIELLKNRCAATQPHQNRQRTCH